MLGLSHGVHYYCSPGDLMSDTTCTDHPLSGSVTGGTLVMNLTQSNMGISNPLFQPRKPPTNGHSDVESSDAE